MFFLTLLHDSEACADLAKIVSAQFPAFHTALYCATFDNLITSHILNSVIYSKILCKYLYRMIKVRNILVGQLYNN